jgi:hypothetical protein
LPAGNTTRRAIFLLPVEVTMDSQLFASFMDAFADVSWLLRTFGPLLIAFIFFLWRDYHREDRLLTRIKELEEEQRNVILPLVTSCTEVVTKNSQVMELNTKVMERLEHALDRTLN